MLKSLNDKLCITLIYLSTGSDKLEVARKRASGDESGTSVSRVNNHYQLAESLINHCNPKAATHISPQTGDTKHVLELVDIDDYTEYKPSYHM